MSERDWFIGGEVWHRVRGVTISSQQVMDRCGITYRQLDFWCGQGYLRPRRADIVAEGKSRDTSGVPRDFSADEMAVAIRMARLISCGFLAKDAARIARATPGSVTLAEGIRLVVDEVAA